MLNVKAGYNFYIQHFAFNILHFYTNSITVISGSIPTLPG